MLTEKTNKVIINKNKAMDRDKLKLLVRNMKLLVDALESEVYSDVEAYRSSQYQEPVLDYDEVFDDDDGYPD
tara:strand:- start:22 stop:237 length:216 start_codon:yes stop_codon:yes gene_type:complete